MEDKEERKPFWMVFNPRGRAPVVQHWDEQEARQEVERLAQLESGPIYLLTATACAQRTTPPVEWEELLAAPESPEDSRKVPVCGPPPPHLGDSLGAYQCRRCLRVPCRCDWSELERRPKDEHRV